MNTNRVLLILTVSLLSLLIGGSIKLVKNNNLNCEAQVELNLDHYPGQPRFTGLYIVHIATAGKGTLTISGNVEQAGKMFRLLRTSKFTYKSMSFTEQLFYMQTNNIAISEHDNTPNETYDDMFGSSSQQEYRLFTVQRVLNGDYLISNIANSTIPSLICTKSDLIQ